MTPGVGTYAPEAALAAFPDSQAGGTSAPTPGHSAFRSKTVRMQGNGDLHTPGVGTYDHTSGIRKKTFSRNQTFGSTTSRFSASAHSIAETAHLGPGLYRPEHATDLAATVAKQPLPTRRVPPRPPRAVTAPEPSHARLQAEAERGARQPCVGSYDLDVDGRRREEARKQRNTQHFLSKAPRFETGADMARLLLSSHLGPGSHDASLPTQPKAVSSSFTSTRQRFGAHGSFVSDTGAPGPGSYTQTASMIKPTFNITIPDGRGQGR
jgi:hypothetical protein